MSLSLIPAAIAFMNSGKEVPTDKKTAPINVSDILNFSETVLMASIAQ